LILAAFKMALSPERLSLEAEQGDGAAVAAVDDAGICIVEGQVVSGKEQLGNGLLL
jgi:hypothetical protein